jgi:tRNA(Ile)-lysidine synthase
MAKLLRTVRQTIDRNELLSRGSTVVVGVSGGPDSLCLLHLLCRLSADYELALHIAHLHHGLRGAEADADARFVRSLSEGWDLPCTVAMMDVPALARQQRLALEEAARRARYSFLAGVARAVGARTIAVGHNADDQAETVLMHWLRGAGLAGLRGMMPSTPLQDYRLGFSDWGQEPDASKVGGIPSPPILYGVASGLSLVRPLLEVQRSEIEVYCDFYELEPRFDRSNLDTTFFRNWLRHEVLPLLTQHNPKARTVMRRSARVLADDYALLRSLLHDVWPQVVVEEYGPDVAPEEEASGEGDSGAGSRVVFDLVAWRALPTSLQRSTLREAIHRLRRSLRNINFVHVEDALTVACEGTTGDQATLPRGLMLTIGYNQFVVGDAGATEPLPDWPLLPFEATSLPVDVPGITPLPDSDWGLQVRILKRDELPCDWDSNADPWRAFVDASAIGGELRLRNRCHGDRFCPLGLGGHKVKLGDFLTNQKVPRIARERLPLLEGAGGIVWVCGQRIDERARVRSETDLVLDARFSRF